MVLNSKDMSLDLGDRMNFLPLNGPNPTNSNLGKMKVSKWIGAEKCV